MTGHRSFSELKKGWGDGRAKRDRERKAELAVQYATLEELRVALGPSQQELADRLDVNQPAISKLTNRGDMRISTLRELVEAMGGELKLTVRFADRAVELASFE